MHKPQINQKLYKYLLEHCLSEKTHGFLVLKNFSTILDKLDFNGNYFTDFTFELARIELMSDPFNLMTEEYLFYGSIQTQDILLKIISISKDGESKTCHIHKSSVKSFQNSEKSFQKLLNICKFDL